MEMWFWRTFLLRLTSCWLRRGERRHSIKHAWLPRLISKQRPSWERVEKANSWAVGDRRTEIVFRSALIRRPSVDWWSKLPLNSRAKRYSKWQRTTLNKAFPARKCHMKTGRCVCVWTKRERRGNWVFESSCESLSAFDEAHDSTEMSSRCCKSRVPFPRLFAISLFFSCDDDDGAWEDSSLELWKNFQDFFKKKFRSLIFNLI